MSGTVAAPPLARWRESLVDDAISFYFLAHVVVVMASLLRPAPEFDGIYVVLFAGVAVTAILRLARQIPTTLRVVGVVANLSVSAVAVVQWLGLVPPAVALVLATNSVFLAVGVGPRAAVGYLVLLAAAFLAVGALTVSGSLTPRLAASAIFDPHDFRNWVRQTLGAVVLSGVLAFAVLGVVRRIEQEALARRAEDDEHGRCDAALLGLARDHAIESGDIGRAFAHLVDASASGLGVHRTSIWMLENAGTRLRRVALKDGSEAADPVAALDVDECPDYFAALAAGRSVAAEDARTNPTTHELRESYLDRHRITSMLCAPIRLRHSIVGVVCHEHVGLPRKWSAEAQSFAGSLADFAARALAAAERSTKGRELHDAYELLGRLHRKVESAKEEERRHLARELHDELGQVLTALKLRLQLASRSETSAGTPPRLGDAVYLVDGLIARVRKLSVDLSPPLLVEAGIAAAIRAYLEGPVALAGLAFDLEVVGLDGRLSPELEIAAFRVMQEAVTNVLRHAKAKRVRVSIERDEHRLSLSVKDDGAGFDVRQASEGARAGRHFGLAGIRERAKGLGGTVEVSSSRSDGTKVHVTLPLSPPASVG